mgnify:CR=1 FL=1
MPGAGSMPVASITLDDRIAQALADLEGSLAALHPALDSLVEKTLDGAKGA